jgi:hypothetical protein
MDSLEYIKNDLSHSIKLLQEVERICKLNIERHADNKPLAWEWEELQLLIQKGLKKTKVEGDDVAQG